MKCLRIDPFKLSLPVSLNFSFPSTPLTAFFSLQVAVSYEDGEALDEETLLQSTLSISATVTLASGVTAALPKVHTVGRDQKKGS